MKKIQSKTTLMKYVELTSGVELETLLHEMYIDKEYSIQQISDELNVHYHTINTWLKLAGIEMRLPHQKLMELIELKQKLGGK